MAGKAVRALESNWKNEFRLCGEFSRIAGAGRRALSKPVIVSFCLKCNVSSNWETCKCIKETAFEDTFLPCWKLLCRLTVQPVLLQTVAESSTSSIFRYEAKKDNFGLLA